MSESAPLVILDRYGPVAIITFNRPEKRNAMNRAAQSAFCDALEASTDASVIVLTGNGPAFCSGVDLVEASTAVPTGRAMSTGSHSWFEIQEQIKRHPAVFVAAVNGFAVGGGLTLVNNAELAIASTAAEFGAPEMSFGAFPGLAGPSTIHRILPKHAAQLIFTAQRVDAQSAFRMGLVNEVVEPEQLIDRAFELAHHIAQFDPVLLDHGKRAYREAMRLDWSQAIEYGITTGAVIRSLTTTARDGVAAFARGERSVGQATTDPS